MMSVSEFISLLLMTIFMQVVFVINYGNMIKEKAKINYKYILTMIITSIALIINNYYNLLFLRFFTGIFINFITAKIIYNNKINITIFYSIIHAIICLVLEIVLSPILMFNFKSIDLFNNDVYIKIFFSIFSGILTIFIFKNKNINSFINKVKKVFFNKKTHMIIFIIVLLFLDILIFTKGMEINNIYLIIATLNAIIFMLITMKTIVNDRYNMDIVNMRTNEIKANIKAYSKTIDDCRELKHNLKNDLLTLKSGVNLDSQDKINEIIKKYNNNYEWINMIDNIPEGLQGLIYLKQKESENKKIKLYVNTIKNIKTNNKDYIDLCSVLGVLIDNAIEATKNTKSKVVEINFKEEGKNLNIRISNNYSNYIDVNKIGNKNYSTKEYKSGLGLNFVNKINNSKIKVNFKIINNLFITDILYSIKN